MRSTANPVHSIFTGAVRTDIFREAQATITMIVNVLFWWGGKNAWQGAQTTLHCILTENEDVGGKFYTDCLPTPKLFLHKLVGNVELEQKFYTKTRKMLVLSEL